MQWEGATAKETGAPGLSWEQLAEMVASGLCTVGNHTHRHVRPEVLDEAELDSCTAEVEQHLGVTPRHFAYTWGVPVPRMERRSSARFRSAATGTLGRNLPGEDPMRLRRVPVRQSDPDAVSSRRSSTGDLGPERVYATSRRRSPRGLGFVVEVPLLRGPGGRPLRLGHLTTVGVSQAKLLATELRVDVAAGLDTIALSAPTSTSRPSKSSVSGTCHCRR